MTANLVAQVVQNLYNKIDINKMSEGFDKIKQFDSQGRVSDEWVNREIKEKSYIRWCHAIALLESYCKMNLATFQETELVYKWARRVCDDRNAMYNQWRAYGGYSTFNQWLNKKYS